MSFIQSLKDKFVKKPVVQDAPVQEAAPARAPKKGDNIIEIKGIT